MEKHETRRTADDRAFAPDGAGRAAAALAGAGQPLSPALRVYFEPRFGRDFSGVTIHAGREAAEGAAAIGARAFTLGSRIGFADGQWRPGAPDGLRLLAHELAHVAQDGAAGLIRRKNGAPAAGGSPTPSAAMPPTRGFDQLWAEFEQLHQSDPARAAEIAAEFVPVMSIDQTRRHGIRLLFWLMDQGRWDLAQQVLSDLSDVYMIDFATNQLARPGLLGTQSPDPAVLVRRAEAEARAGRHEPASRLFAVGYELAQMLLIDLSAARRAELTRIEAGIEGSPGRQVALAQASTAGVLSPTMQVYPGISRVLDVIRDIFGFYPREEIRAQLAGDAAAARQASGLGLVLRTSLLEDHTLSGDVLTMETVAAFNQFGQRGYALRGATGPEEIVTPLPGTPTPEELGLFPAFTSTMASLAGAIAGQEAFMASLYQEPEIRRAFGARRPDMNNRDDRLQVWSAMYRAYQRQDVLGLGSLHALMSLIGEYLRNYTRHTEYNIRDFGVSYLSSEFPTDLAGRAVRDCGVYALTVAHEVYRTARAARPRLNLEFRLYSMPEHVTLVIFDLGERRHYLVNNDQVSPSRAGGPGDPETLESVANAYAQTFGRRFAITPMQDVSLGTTAQGEAAFRTQAWQRYLVTTLWGLQTEPPSGPADPRTEAERAQDTYRRYYEDLATFDRGAARLQRRLDELSAAHRRTPPADRRTHLAGAVAELFDPGLRLAGIFDRYGPHARTVAEGDPARVRGVLGPGFTPQSVVRTLGARGYLFAHRPGAATAAHPLPRLAGLLLRFQSLGGTLTSPQQSFVDWVRTVPGLAADLAGYERAGMPEGF